MRVTNALLKHNIWRIKKSIWYLQRNRKIMRSDLQESLGQRNVEILDAKDVAALPKTFIGNVNIVGPGPIQPKPETLADPNYNEERIFIFKDSNALLEGLEQAKVLTNTVEPLSEKVLPSQITNFIDVVSHPHQDRLVKRCIRSSLLFDTEQVKLPIKKDPERPAWIFARDYGISHKRRNELLSKKLFQLCEMITQMSGSRLSEERFIVDDAQFSVPLIRNNEKILLDLKSELLLTSRSVLSPISDPEKHENAVLPDISPLLPTVSLDETNYYKFTNKFPFKSGPQGLQVHTAMIHYDVSEVKNLFGEKIEEKQIFGRSLLKSYAFAVAQARQNYGLECKGQLPAPITVQTVQTNAQWFLFSVMQLNTFDLVNTSIRNYFWCTPLIDMYSICDYEDGIPTLKDYNPDVFKYLLAFYNNIM